MHQIETTIGGQNYTGRGGGVGMLWRGRIKKGGGEMGKVITLSHKHGINPSLAVCYYCGKDDWTIILPGKLKGDAEAPHRAVWSMDPCMECAGYMAQGIILISVRPGPPERNPYRTGGWVVVREDAVRRMIPTPDLLANVLDCRWAFVPDDVWNMVGLPRGEDKRES